MSGLLLVAQPVWASWDCAISLVAPPAENSKVRSTLEIRLPEIQKVSQALSRKYPPQEYEYVFLGRGLSTLFTYYAVMKMTMYPNIETWVLPVSLKDHSEISSYDTGKRFRQLFDRFRPKPGGTGRKIIFIDYVHTGRTFIQLERILRATGIEGGFVGITDDILGVREALSSEHENLRMRELDLIPIQLNVQMNMGDESWLAELNLGEETLIAPYEQGRIQQRDFDVDSISPMVVTPTFIDAFYALKKMLFGDF